MARGRGASHLANNVERHVGPGRPPRPAKGTRFGGGRKKGQPNRTTVEIRTAARALVEDAKYVRNLKTRLRKGTAPHMETLLFHYSYGKPRDKVELSGPGGKSLGYDISKLSLQQLRAVKEILGPVAVEIETHQLPGTEEDPDDGS